MHSHHIALALADARVADLQRAATHTTASGPPRRHRRALALLGLAATAVLAALAPTGALAQPLHDVAAPANAPAAKLGDTPADFAQPVSPAPKLGDTPVDHPGPSHAAIMRSLARHQRQLDARLAPPALPGEPAPVQVVRDARAPVADDAFSWADAGIGAGGMLGLNLLALGSILAVVHRRQSAAAGQPATTA